MRELRILQEAEQEYHSSIEYYSDRDPGVGSRFVSAVEDKLQKIRESPLSYALVSRNIREAIVAKFPYAIYFTVNDESVDVWAVFHHCRNPVVWQSRTGES